MDSYKLGLSLKRATWLVEWLRGLAVSGKAEARSFAQGLGRLGFASIALDWERPWSATRLVFCGSGEVRLASGAAREWRATAEARAATGGRGAAELLHGPGSVASLS